MPRARCRTNKTKKQKESEDTMMVLPCHLRPSRLYGVRWTTRCASLFCLNNITLTHAFHDWIFQASSGVPHHHHHHHDHLVALAQQTNVHRIGFLRHGQTLPSPPGGIDFDRCLSEKGREQVAEAGSSFGKELLPFYHSMLVSPAPRTTETAQIFLQAALVANEETNNIQIQPVQSLYDGTMQPGGNAIFRRIGYAPLRAYVDVEENDIVEDRELIRTLLSRYAHDTANAIAKQLQSDEEKVKVNDTQPGTTLWVVGHAIYLPSAVLGVATLANCDESCKEMILSTSTREAEGYLVDLISSTVRYLERPSSRLSP